MYSRNSRRLTVSIIMLMVLNVISGCTAGNPFTDDQGTGNADIPGKPESVSKAGLPPVKLRYYFPGDKKAAADEVWNALSEEFKDRLNCTYEVNWIPIGDYRDKLVVMAASGDDWDMNYDGPWQAYTQMLNKGAYMDIKDLLPRYAPDLYEKYKETGTLEPATVDGRILSLPWTLSGSLRPWLNWRSDAAKAAGLDIPQNSITTIEDVDAVLHRLKNAYPDKVILCVGNIMLGQVFDITLLRDGYMATEFHNLYVKVDDPTCRLIPIETTETFRETVKLTRKWVEDGIISKDEMIDKTYAADKWFNGQVLARTITHEFSFCNNPFKDPSYTRESSELYPGNQFFNRTPLGNSMCINANAANPERALMWMNMLQTDQDFYDMVLYGIEGKTYILEDGAAKYPAGMSQVSSSYMDWSGQWPLWNLDFMRPDETYGNGFWQKEAEYAKEAKNVMNPMDGLFFNTSGIKNEIARRDQLYEEYGKPLVFGMVKMEKIDEAIEEYLKKEKASGLDKIINECQKQVNAFLKARQSAS